MFILNFCWFNLIFFFLITDCQIDSWHVKDYWALRQKRKTQITQNIDKCIYFLLSSHKWGPKSVRKHLLHKTTVTLELCFKEECGNKDGESRSSERESMWNQSHDAFEQILYLLTPPKYRCYEGSAGKVTCVFTWEQNPNSLVLYFLRGYGMYCMCRIYLCFSFLTQNQKLAAGVYCLFLCHWASHAWPYPSIIRTALDLLYQPADTLWS